VLRLADDGLDVAVNDIEANGDELDGVAEELRGKGRRTAAITADVSEPKEVQSMVRRVADRLVQLDVMVANAGIAQVIPLLDLTPDDWDLMMSINLRGVFLCYQAAAKQMIDTLTSGSPITTSLPRQRLMPTIRTSTRHFSGRARRGPPIPTVSLHVHERIDPRTIILGRRDRGQAKEAARPEGPRQGVWSK
jgi:NAD(P)-dependent dehydrogenase (short-subunit alcohol dehydrogenase family)